MTKQIFSPTAGLLLAISTFGQTQKATLDVVVKNRSNERIPNDKITFIGQESRLEVVGITDANGEFVVQLPAGDDYAIKVEMIGKELDYNTFGVPSPPPGAVFKPVTLEIIYELPTSFVLEDLYFESGQYSIKKKSYDGLNKLADYLVRKGVMNIRIDGYTDSDGSESSNQTLSANRSSAVKKYLVRKGVSANRIKTVGKGELDPIASNDSPDGKAKNRRTEIHIIE